MQFPTSPDKKPELRPNAHPYAIKTTSTALLSRSNSSPQHNPTHVNRYVPPSPTAQQPTRQRSISTHPNGHGHRYSRSMSSDMPRPLPVPPSPTSSSPTTSRMLDREPSDSFSLEDLPTNPKSWTSSHLASYLSTALRLKSGEALDLPPRVANDIAAFVRQNRITGKVFLRFSESDLEAYGMNKLWQNALLTTSRNLRQNVLKGQIWGFGNPLDESPHSPSTEDDNTPNSRHLRRSNSNSYLSNPFVNGTAFYASDSSASSSEDLVNESPTQEKMVGRYRNGRVKGMVQTFERTTSFDEGQATFVRERSGSIHSVGSSSESGLDDESLGRNSMYRTARKPPTPPFILPAEEELPMEELLAKSPSPMFPSPIRKKRRGVHAWEEDDGAGVTSTGGPRAVADIFAAPDKVDVSVLAQDNDATAIEEEETRLKSEVEHTKGLLEEFRKRLISVENKITEMEDRQKQREELQASSSESTQTVPTSEDSIFTKVLGGVFGGSTPESDDIAPRRVSPYERLFNPKTISALPSYLVLVSIGVCAVVFKVVLKRTLGIAISRRK